MHTIIVAVRETRPLRTARPRAARGLAARTRATNTAQPRPAAATKHAKRDQVQLHVRQVAVPRQPGPLPSASLPHPRASPVSVVPHASVLSSTFRKLQENHPPASPGGGVPLGMTTIADKCVLFCLPLPDFRCGLCVRSVLTAPVCLQVVARADCRLNASGYLTHQIGKWHWCAHACASNARSTAARCAQV